MREEILLRAEEYLARRRHRMRMLRAFTAMALVVAAVAILIATLVMPILHISGSSMTPVIGDGDIAAVIKGHDFDRGDIIAFYYSNKVLVKRVIAFSGEWVNIDSGGGSVSIFFGSKYHFVSSFICFFISSHFSTFVFNL